MYNETYEEYIRSILGYPYTNNVSPTYNSIYEYNNNEYYPDLPNTMQNSELEECYPEIYKIVYPMVKNACSRNTKQLTKDVIEEMTDEIYYSLEATTEEPINVNINLNNSVRKTSTSGPENRANITVKEVSENKKEDRSSNNSGIRDIIKILLLRELLGRPGGGGFPGNRPPFRPNPRPPFPGGPGRPGYLPPRPPIMPRND